MKLKFISSIFRRKDKTCGIKGTITLPPSSYEVFRALSYEWISDPSDDLPSAGIHLFHIRLRSGLPEKECRDSLELLSSLGLVKQNSPDCFSVTALGAYTTLYQEEGKKYLEELDRLADEWWEEQQKVKARWVFRENYSRKTKQCPLCLEEE